MAFQPLELPLVSTSVLEKLNQYLLWKLSPALLGRADLFSARSQNFPTRWQEPTRKNQHRIFVFKA